MQVHSANAYKVQSYVKLKSGTPDSFPVSHGSGKRTEVLEHKVYISRKLNQKQRNWISSRHSDMRYRCPKRGSSTTVPHVCPTFVFLNVSSDCIPNST